MQLKDGAFLLPAFKLLPATSEQINSIDDSGEEASGAQQLVVQYQNTRKDKGLTYNHYANSGPSYDIELQPQLIIEEQKSNTCQDMVPSIVNGYDGFGGVHNNLVWDQSEGWMAYSLHNKVIFELVKTREQTVLCDSTS